MNLDYIEKIRADLYCGFSFFFRFPTCRLYHNPMFFSFARALWTWPFVACLLGFIEGGMLYSLHETIQLTSWITAFTGLGFHCLITGGLHEDGLADCADGFGGGKTISQKLDIMKDSRLGTYGVITLFTVLGIQVSSVSFLLQTGRPIIPLMIVTAILSRTAILFPVLVLTPARSNGTAMALRNIPFPSLVIHLGIAISICLSLVPWQDACLYSIMACSTGAIISFITRQQINGYNGDVLGATQTLTATVILGVSTLLR